jgi:hypothetical protein
MSIDQFIPEVWAARVRARLDKAHVYGQPQVINRDYEGEISDKGDTVHVMGIGDPTIFDYTKNTDMPQPETLSDDRVTLTIDQAKGFNFQVDDVDAVQGVTDVMDAAMARAGYKLADISDLFLAATMVAGAASANAVGTNALPIVAPTFDDAADPVNVYNLLVDLKTRLNEADVPRDNRWVVIPPWFEGLLTKDSRFITALPQEVLLNGQIGRAAGFNVMVSNNVPTNVAPVGAANQSTRYRIVAGHGMGTTFAEQISKTEAYRPERRFGDAVKGLHLYGADVFEPEALAVMTVTIV